MRTPRTALIVRAAAAEDAASIAECLGELGYGTPASLVSQRLAEFAGSNVDAAWVAHRFGTDAVLGVVSAHALPLFHTHGYLVRLTALAVGRKHQGQGVGRQLVEAVEAWSWQMGARRIEVTSGDHRPEAHRFYTAIGYATDERRFVKQAPPEAMAVSSGRNQIPGRQPR